MTAPQSFRDLPTSDEARLALAPARAARAVLDGGWWPRSWDPAAELPGLVVALSARYGPVRRLMLNRTTWSDRVRRLVVGESVVRVGWFTTVDPAVVVATTDRGDQIDLLVVPPQTDASVAEKLMAEAADPANHRKAPTLLAG